MRKLVQNPLPAALSAILAALLLSGAQASFAACPRDFTAVTNPAGSLGCVQQDIVRIKGRVLQLDWLSASDYCFDRHGGRLPSAQELTIANLNLVLTSPTAPVWTGDFFFHAASGEAAVTVKANPGSPAGSVSLDLGYAPRAQRQVFRCWTLR